MISKLFGKGHPTTHLCGTAVKRVIQRREQTPAPSSENNRDSRSKNFVVSLKFYAMIYQIAFEYAQIMTHLCERIVNNAQKPRYVAHNVKNIIQMFLKCI